MTYKELIEFSLIQNGEICMKYKDQDGEIKHSNPNCEEAEPDE